MKVQLGYMKYIFEDLHVVRDEYIYKQKQKLLSTYKYWSIRRANSYDSFLTCRLL